MSKIKFTKDGVSVVPMEIGDCAECGRAVQAGWVISLDFRNAGQTTSFGDLIYCSKECAEEIADRVRESLPDAGKE